MAGPGVGEGPDRPQVGGPPLPPGEVAGRRRGPPGQGLLRLLAPIVTGHRGAFRQELEDLRRQGFATVRIDGVGMPLEPLPSLARTARHEIEAVVADGLSADDPGLPAAVRRALALGRQTLLFQVGEGPPERVTTRHACPGCGGSPPEIGPRLFSFNSPYGACPACQGLGLEDAIDPALLVGDPTRTVREGALVLTTPKGYIIYSQVTMDVLDQVCRAHGFTVDIPWEKLTDDQQRVILYGSDRLKIPFGKHPLESRLKWKGITARPREEDYYKGILPVMEATLARDRNPNILRFVRSTTCRACGGRRLRPEALAVRFQGRSIADLAGLPLDRLDDWLAALDLPPRAAAVAGPVVADLRARLRRLSSLGLGHLTLDRPAPSLAGGEWQRIRLAMQAFTDLQGLLYVLDEPSLGLHPCDQERLLDLLADLRDAGNTVLAVEHREEAVRAADWLLDLGPGAGPHGGRLLYQGPPAGLVVDGCRAETPTGRWLKGVTGVGEVTLLPAGPDVGGGIVAGASGGSIRKVAEPGPAGVGPVPREVGAAGHLEVLGATCHNLQNIDVSFPRRALTVVSGVSGAGKTTLVDLVLARSLRRLLHGATEPPGACRAILGAEAFGKVIAVDQQPIGRTPRSNPATYTGLFDHIRDLFARQPEAVARGFGKGRFSWNVAGGRCETCQGCGVQEIGLHLLDPVEVTCEDCGGRRYLPETLAVTWNGLSIADVLDLTVEEAVRVFAGEPPMLRILQALAEVGLGYLALGQPSTTLSGGEAQRVKLAGELARPAPAAGRGPSRRTAGKTPSTPSPTAAGRSTLYILDEPATGLHHADVRALTGILRRLTAAGHTVIAVEHHPDFLRAADWIVDLGPEGGEGGGRVVVAGPPAAVMACPSSPTGRALARGSVAPERHRPPGPAAFVPWPRRRAPEASLRLEGASTHTLRAVDVALPRGRFTVVTGVSGSGKSSLVMGTLLAESHRRYVQSLSAYARRFVEQMERPPLAAAHGLTPVIAIGATRGAGSPRSTVGTQTGCLDLLRILWSRAGVRHCPQCGAVLAGSACPAGHFSGVAALTARLFSFNHVSGACTRCHGMGLVTVCDPDRLVTHPGRSLLDGALDGTRTGRFYGERDGRYVATLAAVGHELGHDFSLPWQALSADARAVALDGCGDRVFAVSWRFRRGQREGEHRLETPWAGLRRLVEEEFDRKRADHRGEAMTDVMADLPCPGCGGDRLQPEFRAVRWQGLTLGDLCRLPVQRLAAMLRQWMAEPSGGCVTAEPARETMADAVALPLLRELAPRLEALCQAGLGYLTLDRTTASLSGGEFRRLLLASRLGADLTGVTYLLDEPTIGLHPRDTASLLGLLQALKNQGNTVVAVEHDPEVIRAADHLVELGPGAGTAGGRVVAQGTPASLLADPGSLTARWLGGGAPWPGVTPRSLFRPGIAIRGACRHNLRDLDLDIPLGGLVVLTGVSGSGKSTLVEEVLLPSARAGHPVGCRSFTVAGRAAAGAEEPAAVVTPATRAAAGATGESAAGPSGAGAEAPASPADIGEATRFACGDQRLPPAAPEDHVAGGSPGVRQARLRARAGGGGPPQRPAPAAVPEGWAGIDESRLPFDRVILVDQSLPPGGAGSLVGTLTGALGPLGDLFARTEEARRQGLSAAAFSPFGAAGRCEACQGQGGQTIDLDFLAGVRLVCEECGGTRFRPEILACRHRGHSPADLLALPVADLLPLLADQPEVTRFLEPLLRLGLGHLALGRSTDTLSGGERQRLRLALALLAEARGPVGVAVAGNRPRGRRAPPASAGGPERPPSSPGGRCLFLFDEPTTGLHLADVARLLQVFADLTAAGHSLVVVEHHLEVIRRADWVIDLGPGGGDEGGRLVVAGPPDVVAAHPGSATGAALRGPAAIR